MGYKDLANSVLEYVGGPENIISAANCMTRLRFFVKNDDAVREDALMKLDDVLDYSVGYILQVRIGDHVEEDTPLCELHARNEAEADQAEQAVRAAIEIGDKPCGRAKLFYAEVTAEGTTLY